MLIGEKQSLGRSLIFRAVPEIRIRPDFDEKPDIRNPDPDFGINFIENRQINSLFVLFKSKISFFFHPKKN